MNELAKIAQLCQELDIGLYPLPEDSALNECKGIALYWHEDDQRIIAYDDALREDEKLFTIAHEIAHHVLHLKEEKYREFFKIENFNTKDKTISKMRELEADIFAAVFTAMGLCRKVVSA